MKMATMARRDLATRQAAWAKRLASALASAGVTPNAVSVASVGFAAVVGAAFALSARADAPSRAALLLTAAAAIQLRLLCNLLDGMLALEEGLHTPAGALFNEIPDRVADAIILVAAGSAVTMPGGAALGWLAASVALFTAYVRQLGGALTGVQHFTGPMAKPHRMFVLTLAALGGAVEAMAGARGLAIAIALAVIVAGGAVTAGRRIARIAADLEKQ
jgi:phosphatidylglycerophosphate synthase